MTFEQLESILPKITHTDCGISVRNFYIHEKGERWVDVRGEREVDPYRDKWEQCRYSVDLKYNFVVDACGPIHTPFMKLI